MKKFILLALAFLTFSVTGFSEEYKGSSFDEVWKIVANSPYSVLPQNEVTIGSFFQRGIDLLKKSADSSVFIVLGMVVGKMLLSMIFALIFIYGSSFNKIAFLISFFLPYFIYTAFEIYSLMSNLRALKK
jgi:hypothetical protein